MVRPVPLTHGKGGEPSVLLSQPPCGLGVTGPICWMGHWWLKQPQWIWSREQPGEGDPLLACARCVCVCVRASGRGAAYAHLPAQSPPRLLPLRESRGWQQLPGCEPAQTCGPA